MTTTPRLLDRIGRISATSVFGLCLAAGVFGSASAHALSENPFDPSLPLSVHSRVLCPGATDFTTGSDQASCAGSVVVEGTATLTSVTGDGQAASDLRTGSLRSRGTSHAYRFAADNLRTAGYSHAELYDTITFAGSFEGTVELRMAVQGSFLVDQTTTIMSNRVQGSLSTFIDSLTTVDAAGVRIEQASAGTQATPVPAILAPVHVQGGGSVMTNADTSGLFLDPTNLSFVLSLFIHVSPAKPSFNFIAHLDTLANAFAPGFLDLVRQSDVNFGNTARLELIVPEGVSWSSASGAFLVADREGDGISDTADNCPYFSNASQVDADSDGRGDACECTDQSGDGRNTVSDLVAINTAIFNPGAATPLCDGNNDGLCNVNDIIAANVEIFSPTNTSTCARQPVPGP